MTSDITPETIAGLHDKRVHVVGLASTEGAAMLRFLWDRGVRDLTVHDFKGPDEIEPAFRRVHVGMPRKRRDAVWAELSALPIERRLGEQYLEGIEHADAVFVGQAWYLYPPNLPTLPALRERGVPFYGLTELYFALAPARVLAVTGSYGKSTTSRLVEKMLRQTDQRTYYAGNERRSVQVLDRLDEMTSDDWLVLEVSNRQLIDLTPRPAVGVITNILPNHLDEHGGSFEAYQRVKRKLVAAQTADDCAVLNADDPASREIAPGLPGQVYWFSRAGEVERGAWLADGRIRLRRAPDGPTVDAAPIDALRLPGAHNEANALAAALAAWLAGADPAAIARGLRAFRGLRHRVQFVWGAHGVDYYDDLSATTPQATLAALRALDGPITLIAGGEDKGLDCDDLAREIVARARRLVLLPGAGADRIGDAVRDELDRQDATLPIDRFEELPAAVADVVAGARPGDRVLLSPACPYFFSRYYLDGGSETGFRALLRELTTEPTSAEGDA